MPGSIRADRCEGATVARPGACTQTSRNSITALDRSGASAPPADVRAAPSRISKVARAAETPSEEAWNCEPTSRSGRRASGVSMMIVSPVKRETSPLARRRPTSTATSAVDSVARNSRTAPERKATYSVFIVFAA